VPCCGDRDPPNSVRTLKIYSSFYHHKNTEIDSNSNTTITIQIPVNFNVFLAYYPKVTVPHTVVQFLLDQGITEQGSVGADNANMW
jgi:hypothetical protein